jgi:hypothetical protein
MADLAGKQIDRDWPFDRDAPQLVRARRVLNEAGVRKFFLDGELVIGTWSDLDSPEIRAALLVLESSTLPVLYLDGPGIPASYKERRAPGEPVPMNILKAMVENPLEPWRTRDKLLIAMNWSPYGVPWPDWQAAKLNRTFEDLGVTGKPSRITPKTVSDGER